MNRKNIAALLALVGVLGLLPGCFLSREYVNGDIDPEVVAQLVPGTTTAREVVELLGAPSEVVELGRRSAYRYEHAQEKTAVWSMLVLNFLNRDLQSDRAWVFFDEADVLTHVGATYRAEDAEYAMPWVGHD